MKLLTQKKGMITMTDTRETDCSETSCKDDLMQGLMALFAQAAGIAYEDVKRMGAKDCKNAIAVVRSFFIGDLEDSSEEVMSDE